MMTRFSTILLLTLLCVSHVGHGATEDARGKQPHNMIFILVDDLRFDGMGFLQEQLQTPHIDRLARQGVYFPNAVVTSSLCSPSRATILTGLTTRNHGVVDNNNSSEEGLVFFPRYLQEAGYQTAFVGKWHMGDATDAPRPGFDRWVSFAGQGAYYPTDMIPPELLAKGVVNRLNVDGRHVEQKGYITDELTDYALDWLADERDPTKPFFLYLSHKAVHSDAKPAQRHRNQYAKTEFELPQTVEITPEYRQGKPMWVKNQRNSWHGIDFFYASDRKMTDYLKDYYGALSSVDDSIGRIMAYLRKSGLDDETMVVFYSDNGFLIGDHGLIDKRNAYEGSIRVPMVVSAPGLLPVGVTNEARVRNLDLAPTFLDLAGVEPPQQFEGKSFLPVATGEQPVDEWGEPDFVYEYYWEWSFPMTPTTFAIQRGPLKYIQYHGVWDIEELYDVERDPLEKHNLIDDPAYYDDRQALRVALYEQLESNSGDHSVPFHARLAEGMNLRDQDGPKAAPFPDEWLVEPNRPDMFNGLFPDTPLKKKTSEEGKPYFPYMEELSRDERPNILLIVAEDMSGRVGAFGDEMARTPSIDALANQGIRFPNAFAVSGVCAPSRSALMTGVHAISMGTHQMRTSQGVPGTAVESYEAVPPPEVKAFPELLRAAGYATANFAKKDYQFGEPFTIWDVDAGGFTAPLEPALWRRLPEDKPFFVMLNLMVTHESRLGPPGEEFDGPFAPMMEGLARERAKTVARVTDPAAVTVPPYFPDTERVRASIAQHYDNIHFMDGQVRQILEALDQDGLADETIVIWTTDNGDGFPRAKRAVYDSGIKVPMVVRFPDGHGSGSVRNELVSFVDLAPTILQLAGAEIPEYVQGQDFLHGPQRQYVFAARDRMDAVLDRVRAVRDRRYKYIRNFEREVPYFRPLLFRDMFPIMQELWSGFHKDSLTRVQQFYFTAPRPAEELYDTQADPDETNNLADDRDHREVLARMRTELDRWLEDAGDRGAQPEIEMLETMWPGREQPVTATPEANFGVDEEGTRYVALSSTTRGASIGYRWADSDSPGRWKLYTQPVRLPAGAKLETKAIRYGYAESPVNLIGPQMIRE